MPRSPCRNDGGSTFFPWAYHPFLAKQESRFTVILRFASAPKGAASIVSGLLIAIEAAVVAELENSKEK